MPDLGPGYNLIRLPLGRLLRPISYVIASERSQTGAATGGRILRRCALAINGGKKQGMTQCLKKGPCGVFDGAQKIAAQLGFTEREAAALASKSGMPLRSPSVRGFGWA